MSINQDDDLTEEDIIADLQSGEVDRRIQEADRGRDARGEPITVPLEEEEDVSLRRRVRAGLVTTASIPTTFIDEAAEQGQRFIERGQQAVRRGRMAEAQARERLDEIVEERTGVDLPEARRELRELDPFDRLEGRRRELEIVGRVRDPIAERAEPITEPVSEQVDRLGAGAVAVGRGVSTRVVPAAAVGTAVVEGLERLEDAPGFRGEVEPPEERVDEQTELPVPEQPAVRAERGEIPVSEDQTRTDRQGEIGIDETQREGTFREEIGVPEEQTRIDPRIVQTQQIVTGREVDRETEVVDDDQVVITEEELLRPEDVRVPEEERFTQIREELERQREAERPQVEEEFEEPGGFRERFAEQQIDEPRVDVDQATEPAIDVDQAGAPRVDQDIIPAVSEDTLASPDTSLDQLDDPDTALDDIQITPLDEETDIAAISDLSIPQQFVPDFPPENPPEFPPEYPPEFPPAHPPEFPPETPPGPPPIQPPTQPPRGPPKLPEFIEELEDPDGPGQFSFQRVTSLPAPDELNEPPSLDPDTELDSLKEPSFEEPDFKDP